MTGEGVTIYRDAVRSITHVTSSTRTLQSTYDVIKVLQMIMECNRQSTLSSEIASIPRTIVLYRNRSHHILDDKQNT